MEPSARWHIMAVGLPLDFVSSSLQETGSELAQRAIEGEV
jgi:hypothetical protein